MKKWMDFCSQHEGNSLNIYSDEEFLEQNLLKNMNYVVCPIYFVDESQGFRDN
jgi:hypothetical protein